jgi:Ca-activated chloride channel family protein
MRHRLLGATAALAITAAACVGNSDDAALTTIDIAPEAGSLSATTMAVWADREVGYAAGGEEIPNARPYDLTFFENYGVNPRIDTIEDALSTFAVDVDTGSYTIGRRWITDGFLPDDDSVRVEEYVNYFDQGYVAPTDEPFAIYVDGGPTPFVESDRYRLLRIGLQSMVVDDADRPPANLTFVVDVSGSMDREDRLATVRTALTMLVGELRDADQVALVTYGDRADVVLEPTAVEDSEQILRAINRLRPEGATNAAEGLVVGYQVAERAFTDGAINRVILASDGVANVGETGPDAILESIEEASGSGIHLVTVGFGMGNYNDVLMEQLADAGDGFYAYVDDLREAERLFVHDLTGTLLTVAEDAKVQVEFDPATVERWRLVGFENRDVADEDFRNDDVDAGEIGAGHSVTALYELRLAEGLAADARLGTVRLRWRDPASGETAELDRDVTAGDLSGEFDETDPRFRLAATVAAYAEVLRDSYWTQGFDLGDVATQAELLAELLAEDEDVVEFVDLLRHAVVLAA